MNLLIAFRAGETVKCQERVPYKAAEGGLPVATLLLVPLTRGCSAVEGQTELVTAWVAE